MKMKKTTLLLLLIGSALLAGGCGKQGKNEETEVVFDTLFVSEGQIETNTVPETPVSQPTETEPENVQEQTSDSDTHSLSSTGNETQTTSQPAAVTMTGVVETFHPNEEWTSEISFQMPDDWDYIVDDDSTDWGCLVRVQKREDATIRIFGQAGTLNVEGFYTDPPEDFATANGMKGKFYRQKSESEDGLSYISWDVVFDQISYGVDILMPESVYSENSDAIQKLLQSIDIKDSTF